MFTVSDARKPVEPTKSPLRASVPPGQSEAFSSLLVGWKRVPFREPFYLTNYLTIYLKIISPQLHIFQSLTLRPAGFEPATLGLGNRCSIP